MDTIQQSNIIGTELHSVQLVVMAIPPQCFNTLNAFQTWKVRFLQHLDFVYK
jgi:hypothetical protein